MHRDDIAARLLAALEQGDDLALASYLNPDARMLVDTGDHTGGELRGRARVTGALKDLLERHPDAALVTVHVNGGLGLALRRGDGMVIGVLSVGPDLGGSIGELWLSTARGKLADWNRRQGTERRS